MTSPVRITLAVVASFTTLAYIAFVWLTAALGGPWQLVLACIVALCLLSLAAVVGLAWRAKDDPVSEPDDCHAAAGSCLDLYDDRDRWAS